MKHIILATFLVLVADIKAPARQSTADSTGALNTPVEEARKLTTEEERAFKLALAYAETEEPGLDFRLSRFEVIARDSTSKVWTVLVDGTPKKGSKWRCASVGFKVLVHPDGKVSEANKGLRYCW